MRSSGRYATSNFSGWHRLVGEKNLELLDIQVIWEVAVHIYRSAGTDFNGSAKRNDVHVVVFASHAPGALALAVEVQESCNNSAARICGW